MPSAFMRGPRSAHAPDPQKLPVLSVENDCAMSGALPPRIAATILSSLIPPTVLTFTPGCARSKPATTPLMVFSSRWVKPTQRVTVAGLSCASAPVPPAAVDAAPGADELDEDGPPLLPPPHAATTSAAASRRATSAATRARGRRDRRRRCDAVGTADIGLPSPRLSSGAAQQESR